MGEFNVWDYDEETLCQLILVMFQTVPDLIETLGIDVECLQRFILAACNGYNNVFYHNIQHGFSVMQFAYYIIHHSDITEMLPPLEIFSMLVAGLTHDIDHPGHTNGFECENEGSIALKYNYQAVLENHHAWTTLQMLRNPETNVLDPNVTKLKKADIKRARNCIVQGILATDMTKHFEICQTLDKMKPRWGSLSMDKVDDRQMMINVAVHSADLGGNAQPLEIAEEWRRRIHQEFSAQVVQETELGIESLPFMKNLDDSIVASRNQRNFLDFVMKPLWKSLVLMWPNVKQSEVYLDMNRDNHAKIIALGTAENAKKNDHVEEKKEHVKEKNKQTKDINDTDV